MVTIADAPFSLIGPDDHAALLAVIAAGVALSIWLEQRYRWAARVSAPLLGLVIAMILSNIKVMPAAGDTPVYEMIDGYIVPLAIPLLLFKANVLAIIRTSGSMFIAFHVAAVGTLLGAAIAGFAFRNAFDHSAEITGIMTGSYIGGGVNFGAVKESFDVSDNLTNPLLVADNFIMAGMFAVLFALAAAKWCRKLYPHPHTLEAGDADPKQLAAEHWKRKGVSLLDIAGALAVAFVIAAAAKTLSPIIQGEDGGFLRAVAGNPFVLLTAISVIIATLFHGQLSRIHGAEELGAWFLIVYLFKIGLPADLWVVIQEVPVMFLFCLVIAVVNLLFTMLVGRALRLNLEELLVCINATLGGPPTAVAMAISKGWSRLILPALLVGIWGYAIGTLLGVMVAEALMRV